MSHLYDQICTWDNLYLAWRRAARGKRGREPAASFEYRQDVWITEALRSVRPLISAFSVPQCRSVIQWFLRIQRFVTARSGLGRAPRKSEGPGKYGPGNLPDGRLEGPLGSPRCTVSSLDQSPACEDVKKEA